MLYTTKTISEKWTTAKGSEISLSITIETYDYEWKMTKSLTVNGKTMTAGDFQDNVLNFREFAGGTKMGVIVSEKMLNDIDNAIKNAKRELAPRVAEYNAREELERNMD